MSLILFSDNKNIFFPISIHDTHEGLLEKNHISLSRMTGYVYMPPLLPVVKAA